MASSDTSPPPSPPIFNYIIAVILVSLAWGFTTPFIRRGALSFHPSPHPSLDRIDTSSKTGWVKYKILKGVWTVADLLRSPRYAVPLVVNLTGSVWFFLLVGGSGSSYLSFLFLPVTSTVFLDYALRERRLGACNHTDTCALHECVERECG